MAWNVDGWDAVPGLLHGFGGKDDPAPEGVVTLRQVHGCRVVDSRRDVPPSTEGDALVADASRRRPVGVWTADCVPILLLAREPRVAGAVHSGWRGSLAGVLDAAVEALGSHFGVEPGGIDAALGPAIGGCCYEVGDEVLRDFRAGYPRLADDAFRERQGRPHLDLRHFLALRAGEIGLGRIETVGPCTACTPERLWSRRRQGGSGRQISFIGFAYGGP